MSGVGGGGAHVTTYRIIIHKYTLNFNHSFFYNNVTWSPGAGAAPASTTYDLNFDSLAMHVYPVLRSGFYIKPFDLLNHVETSLTVSNYNVEHIR